MNTTLATKYRPSTFEEVVGQNITTKILTKVVETNNFKNCYLFAGASGCGKTTLARIFANKINNNVDQYIEIDGASNNGVDNVRNIIEAANQRSLTSEYKIFIIDECHALTSAAWQAFLKAIEETPKYTIFIFCTTEPNKIPITILNRVQRYNISPLPQDEIKARLEYICDKEGFTNYELTCDLISKTCQGCLRDAITTLNQCADFSTDLSLDIAKAIVGGLSYENMFNLTWAITEKNASKVIEVLDSLYDMGTDMKHFLDSYLDFLLNLNKFILFKSIDLTSLPKYLASAENPVVQYTVEIDNALEVFNKLIDYILNLKFAIKYDTAFQNTIKASLLKYCWSDN